MVKSPPLIFVDQVLVCEVSYSVGCEVERKKSWQNKELIGHSFTTFIKNIKLYTIILSSMIGKSLPLYE